MNDLRNIEADEFEFEFLSQIAENESWRKEIHRPIYHVHKWWAKRLGTIFRGVILGAALPSKSKISDVFYESPSFEGLTLFDPFMGSGTTIGEAHKLGLTAYGQDINPVAAEAVRIGLGRMDVEALKLAFDDLEKKVGNKIKRFYKTKDSNGRDAEVLYYFWVMQTECVHCKKAVDLFPSFIISKNAYPNKKPSIKIICPECGDIVSGLHGQEVVNCAKCAHSFDPSKGNVHGASGVCNHCGKTFSVISSRQKENMPPRFRLYAKLILNEGGEKEYLPVSSKDISDYQKAESELKTRIAAGDILLPSGNLEKGYNTTQAMNYGFTEWSNFFNARQLLILGLLQKAISEIKDHKIRDAFLVLFSGVLEFNNLFASYKGEGTGAVRHMFSHHILKPEKTPIEANVWGTNKSSGSFSGLFKTRLLKAAEYKTNPVEVGMKHKQIKNEFVFTSEPELGFESGKGKTRSIHLNCGDSSRTALDSKSIDFVITDPPFFDNVHYSELADFFFSWQKLVPHGFIKNNLTTRSPAEVQDADADAFARKLRDVFVECERVLRDTGLLAFSYHHSREEGWKAVADALLDSGFVIVNAHPVKSEMSVATPKLQAKDPIQLDIIIICRKAKVAPSQKFTPQQVLDVGYQKIERLKRAGFQLSKNDEKVIEMTTIQKRSPVDMLKMKHGNFEIVLTQRIF